MGILNLGFFNKKTGDVRPEKAEEQVKVEPEALKREIIESINPAIINNESKKIGNAGKQQINKDMTIGEVVSMYPDTVPVMLENGIHCVGCHVAHWETLEQGFRGHYGMDDERLASFIKQLNEVAGKHVHEVNN